MKRREIFFELTKTFGWHVVSSAKHTECQNCERNKNLRNAEAPDQTPNKIQWAGAPAIKDEVGE